ncbi:MAG: type IV pilus biogenesis/stability protein PilW [Thiotrichaceae bacterium]
MNNFHKLTLAIFFFFMLTSTGCTTNSAIKPEPKKAAKYNALLGAEYLRKGRMKLANEKLTKALEQDPKSADAHHYYALLQEALKQNSKAKMHFSKAIKYSPDNPEINNNYGSFLCKQKQFSLAESHFIKAVKDPLYSTPAFALTNAGICAHDASNLGKAGIFLSKALKKQPNFAPALYATAKLAYDQRNYSRAQAFLFRYNEMAGHSAESLALCKQVHVQLGEIKIADNCSEKLLTLYPNSKEAASLN